MMYGGYQNTIGGYGGFGYDTSHVKKDDIIPTIVTAAQRGDLAAVRRLVNADIRQLNATQRWTEVDFKASGFTKEWEWHGLAPLATAARAGHPAVVRFLLNAGADPTLEGCPEDNVYLDAYKAQAERLKAMKATGQRAGGGQRPPRWPAATPATLEQCGRLLSAAAPFWTRASYASSHFSKARSDSGYSNAPTDAAALQAALAAVPAVHEPGPTSEATQDSSSLSVSKRKREMDSAKPSGTAQRLAKKPSAGTGWPWPLPPPLDEPIDDDEPGPNDLNNDVSPQARRTALQHQLWAAAEQRQAEERLERRAKQNEQIVRCQCGSEAAQACATGSCGTCCLGPCKRHKLLGSKE